jgi:hypothetical protein
MVGVIHDCVSFGDLKLQFSRSDVLGGEIDRRTSQVRRVAVADIYTDAFYIVADFSMVVY